MANIVVQPNKLKNIASDMIKHAAEIKRCEQEIEKICNTLAINGDMRAPIEKGLRLQINALQKERTKIDSGKQALIDIADTYRTYEENITGKKYEKVKLPEAKSLPATESSGKNTDNNKNKMTKNQIIQLLFDKIPDLSPAYTFFIETVILPLVDTVDNGMEKLQDAIDHYPTLEEHYNRNKYMPMDQLPQSPQEAKKWGWNGGVKANCHQNTAIHGKNVKYVSPDGKMEVIFDANDQIVTDPRDVGTYNFCSPVDDPIGHVICDILPWIVYGNSPDDKTEWTDHLAISVMGDKYAKTKYSIDTTIQKGKEAVDKVVDTAEDIADKAVDYIEDNVEKIKFW